MRKAILLEKSYQRSCDICLSIDSTAPKGIKFFCYEEGFFQDPDKYVCSECLSGLKEIRRKIILKVNNPRHDIFKDWVPWLAVELPGILKTKKDPKSLKKD